MNDYLIAILIAVVAAVTIWALPRWRERSRREAERHAEQAREARQAAEQQRTARAEEAAEAARAQAEAILAARAKAEAARAATEEAQAAAELARIYAEQASQVQADQVPHDAEEAQPAAAAEVEPQAESAEEAELARIYAEHAEAAALADAERRAAEEREAREREAARAEAERQEALRREAEQREAERQEAERREARRRAQEQALQQEQARQAAEAQARAEAAAAAAAVAAATRELRADEMLVLVADDSKIVRVKLGRLLGAQGYRVALAESGEQALELLAAERPHALITDVEMPGIDGFELTRHVRATPATAALPVLMITGSDDKQAAAAEAGVTQLLGKPYSEEALIAAIEQARLAVRVPA